MELQTVLKRIGRISIYDWHVICDSMSHVWLCTGRTWDDVKYSCSSVAGAKCPSKHGSAFCTSTALEGLKSAQVFAIQPLFRHYLCIQAIQAVQDSTSLNNTGTGTNTHTATVFRSRNARRNARNGRFAKFTTNTVGRFISVNLWPLKLILEPKFASGPDLSTSTEAVSLYFYIGLLTINTNYTTISALKPMPFRNTTDDNPHLCRHCSIFEFACTSVGPAGHWESA